MRLSAQTMGCFPLLNQGKSKRILMTDHSKSNAPDQNPFTPPDPPAIPQDDSQANPWNILVVDDDEDIHLLTQRVMRDLRFQRRGIRLISAFSAAEAQQKLQQQPEIAVLLLDVVMETDHAGLDLVRFLREELGNTLTRIILRTGQTGAAPELKVITNYDINDYRDKTELTSQKLLGAVTVALRGYQDLMTIQTLARKLRKERETLAKTEEIAHTGSWEWAIDTGQHWWSDGSYRILGLEPGSITPNQEIFQKMVHLLDWKRLQTVLQEAVDTGNPFEVEHRITRPNSDVRTVRMLGEIVTSKPDGPRSIVGALHDITEKRAVEEHLKIATTVFGGALAEVEEQIHVTTKVFEHAIEGVMITDPTSVIQSINPAFTRITGYSATEAIGHTPTILHSNRQGPEFYQNMWRQIHETGQWQGEIWNRRKDGEACPLWETITAITNRKGEVIHYAGVFHDLTAIKANEQEIQFKTYHDTLTGLPNRDLFIDRLHQAIGHANRGQNKVLVLFFDLDGFQNVNNSLGYSRGDRLLQEVGQRLGAFIREGDTLARMGGDTFAFILRGIKQPQHATTVVNKLTTALASRFLIQGNKISLSASIGIAFYPDDGNTVETLIKSVDMALKRAKKGGGNTFQFYTAIMGQRADRRLALEKNLRIALEQDQFVLFYQPKVSLKTGRIVGMEALVRWQHPETGMVSPAEFIPLAEETGLIIPLGAWILNTACRQARRWLDGGYGPLRMGVNLSARQFGQNTLYDLIAQNLAQTGLPPKLLELEITESMVMKDVEEVIHTLKRLRSLGLFVAVDDFGTGYSSLSYLKRLPLHTLKIDQSFVRDLTTNSDDAAIISAIIGMAHNLHLNVVAEGVETQEQMVFLRRNQCNEMQGFFFSRPLPADTFTQLLEKEKNKNRLDPF